MSCCSVSPAPIVFGEWTHVAATYCAGTIKIYVNGNFLRSFSDSADKLAPLENTAAVLFGRMFFTSAPEERLKGLLDEVRIWNVVRSDAEIAQNFNRSVSAATPGLVGYWKFDESAANQQVLDSSPLGNHGTLGASTAVAPDDPQRVLSAVPLKP